MFTGEVSLGDYRPNKFACAPEFQQDDYADFNAGVMVMNVKGLRDDLDEFTAFIRENLSNLQAYDQGAYRMFYEGHVDRLDPIYNWKPYWGTSRDARIVHFHGVKPQHVEGLIHGETLPPVLRNLYDQNPVSYQRYVEDGPPSLATPEGSGHPISAAGPCATASGAFSGGDDREVIEAWI